jgi:transcriptional regulator
MGKPSGLAQGTLDLLILKTISARSLHGWAIAQRIQQMSNDVLRVQQGSHCHALHRLEQQGNIKAETRATESGLMARFYSLTRDGRKQLAKELGQWDRLSQAIGLVLRHA